MTKSLILASIAAMAIAAAGCSKSEPTAPDSPADAEPAAATESQAPAVTVLNITGNDMMKFDKTRLEAKAGATVRLVLHNVGTLPKNAMGHNWVLLKKGVSPEAFAASAAAAAKSDYFPADRSADVIAHTRLTGAKEKAEVTFSVPIEPGEYVYICTFPGHLAAGMHGVFAVN